VTEDIDRDAGETDEVGIERTVTRKTVAMGGWQYKVRSAGYEAEEDHSVVLVHGGTTTVLQIKPYIALH
jgi:hypothetical protein